MNHTLEDVDHYWAGDTLILSFVVWDGERGGDRKDLSGASISWWLTKRHQSDRVLSSSDDPVSITISDPSAGEVEVEISAGATEGLGGWSYREYLRITDADGKRSTFRASFSIDGLD